MSTEEKISQEFGKITGYDDVFKTVETIDTISKEENKNWSLKELERLLLSSFKKAGRRALEDNEGVIYTTLSGGIDSSLSLALLRKNFGWETKIVTFTMGRDENHPDIIFGRLAAKIFKTEHHELIPTPAEIHAGLEDFKKDRPNEDLEKAVLKGSFGVYLLFKKIRATVDSQTKTIIVHDGIDEQMGGYFLHRKKQLNESERKENFRSFWQKLKSEHLDSAIKTSQKFGFNLLFPYLDEKLIKFIAKIPLKDRVDIDNEIGKVPMRKIAKKLGVPKGIISRRKRGQNAMLEIEKPRKSPREK